MDFAYTPDDRPPRIIRYVRGLPAATATAVDAATPIAAYDHARNLLVIDQDQFSALTPRAQDELKRSTPGRDELLWIIPSVP